MADSGCGQEMYKWARNILFQKAGKEQSQWLAEDVSGPVWHYLNIKESNDSN